MLFIFPRYLRPGDSPQSSIHSSTRDYVDDQDDDDDDGTIAGGLWWTLSFMPSRVNLNRP